MENAQVTVQKILTNIVAWQCKHDTFLCEICEPSNIGNKPIFWCAWCIGNKYSNSENLWKWSQWLDHKSEVWSHFAVHLRLNNLREVLLPSQSMILHLVNQQIIISIFADMSSGGYTLTFLFTYFFLLISTGSVLPSNRCGSVQHLTSSL